MVTAADTNTFLDVLTSNSFAKDARTALRRSVEEGDLIVSVICYAELVPRFTNRGELDRFLAGFSATTSGVDREIAFLAGEYMLDYKMRGGTRTRILADFLIAAHAQLRADRLLTRDQRFFSEHFPGLIAIHPQEL